jgi:hypothetical protein
METVFGNDASIMNKLKHRRTVKQGGRWVNFNILGMATHSQHLDGFSIYRRQVGIHLQSEQL